MSRLIVKGLPSYVSDARLREHFSQKGSVTDVKLMTRPDGTSRRFGFVGFRSEEEAENARAYFDRTYMDTSRLSVAVARRVGDEELKKGPARRGAAAPAPRERAAPEKPTKKSAKGASFDEFLAVMAPKAKRKTWENDEEAGIADRAHEPERPKKRKAEKAEAADNAVEEASVVEKDHAAENEELSDLEYMRRRMRRKVGGEPEKAFEQSEDEEEDEEADDEEDEEDEQARRDRERLAEEQRKDQENVDIIMQSGRLFVRNLPFAATEEELETFFATFGPVEQVHIPLEAATKTSKGLAFVKFHDPAHALVAFRARDGAIFQGRLLHVIPAVDLKPRPQAPASLKQQRLEAKRASAGKDFNWSVLYMNSDAVASSIADRLGVSKSEILTPREDGGNPAVRLALAETRVIQETREFFEKHGMRLEALENPRERIDDTILVKNIPYGTSGEEIRELFARHGDVGRVLIPPSNTIAVVEMPVVGEARAAFRALAYKRFKDSVLYLEKAPAAFLPPADGTRETVDAASGVRAPESGATLLGVSGGERAGGETAPEQAAATLYIKNLSFGTSTERLTAAFRALEGFVFARVQTKPDPRVPGARQSMGYGFVGFSSAASAHSALKAMQGHVLDGHTLAVSFAKRGHDADDAAAAGKLAQAPSTKMLVKNVPFEATKRDLRELFSAHAQIKSLRLPKQVHGRTRGFAFVEFVSRREAENAMAALRHTHLLGRHLVLEWSGDEAGAAAVDALREKTRRTYVSEAERAAATGQRSKVRLSAEQIADAAAAERARADEEA